jgi:hypothetical protein
MYVNYCGADSAKVMDKIRSARSDCFNRKGHTLKFNDKNRNLELPLAS